MQTIKHTHMNKTDKVTKRKIGRYDYLILVNDVIVGSAENQIEYWEANTNDVMHFKKCKTLKECVEHIVKCSSCKS